MELRQAMDIYYKSKLAAQINAGAYGIDNMDARYLAEDLVENEPELFEEVIAKQARNALRDGHSG